jgi:hypothetical protein
MNEVKGGIVRRIAVQMKQRQCRDVAHMPSIFEPVIDSYGGGKDEAPHDRAGLPNYLGRFGDLLLALLLLTRLLLAALLLLATLTWLRLATLLLTTLLLLAGLLVRILIHSFPLKRCFATSIARFPWRESIRGQCIRSKIHIEAMCLELVPARRVPLSKQGEPTMGRYLLLWLLGVPIPILVLIWLFGGLH